MLHQITLEYVFHFMLVFARLGTAFSQMPGLGSKHIHVKAKATTAITISFAMLPLLSENLPAYTNNITLNISYLFIEILIGLIISIAANLYLLSLHFVGQIISMQSGLSAAAFFDPTQKAQTALFSNYFIMVTIVMLFASNTHYLFLEAIYESYEKFPPGQMIPSEDISKYIAVVVNDTFILAFKLVSPFLVVGLAVLTGSAMLSRLMPNFQVFFVITPGQILLVFCTLYVVSDMLIHKISVNIYNSVNFSGFG